MAEGIEARILTVDIPLVSVGIGSGSQFNVGMVGGAVGAKANSVRECGGKLVNAVGKIGGVNVGGEWVGLGGELGAAEPVGEVEVEVAVAVGRTDITGAVAGGKGSGVGLVGRVAVEGGGGAVLNEDLGAAAAGIGAEADINTGGLFGIGSVAVV